MTGKSMFKKLYCFQRISNKIDPEFWFRLQGLKQTAHFQESGHAAGIVIRTRLITLHIIMSADNDPFSRFRAKGADYVLVLFAVLSEPLYPGAPAGFPVPAEAGREAWGRTAASVSTRACTG